MFRDLIEANGKKLDTIDKKTDDIVNRTETLTATVTKSSNSMRIQQSTSTKTTISGKKMSIPKPITTRNIFANALKKKCIRTTIGQTQMRRKSEKRFMGRKPAEKLAHAKVFCLFIIYYLLAFFDLLR